MNENKQGPLHATKGVQTLLGDPKKAIIKLSLPMILALSLNALYNFVDRIWVSGLGEDALSATGFFMPFFFLAMAVATGIGVGGGSVVSRLIGSHNKKGAESAALHTILYSGILAVIFTIPLMLLSPLIFRAMGATSSLDESISYGTIMFGGIIFLFFTNTANSLLRSEGNAVKAMIAMAVGTFLNIILDPLFIYVFKLGVAGAAIATVISIGVSAVLLLYWLFIQKKSYLVFDFRAFKFSTAATKDIFSIGLPTMLSQGSMSIMMFFIIYILQSIGEDKAVAVYTAGWTIVAFAILPLLGIATAVISVSAAAFGAKEKEKIKTVLLFSTTIGIVIEIVIAVLAFFFAPYISLAFTWSPATAGLLPKIGAFIQIICFYFPASAGGIMANAVFQGMRMAFKGLIVTFLRTIVFTGMFTWIFGIVLGYGVQGVYIGMVIAIILSSIVAFIWSRMSVNNLYFKRIEGETVSDTNT